MNSKVEIKNCFLLFLLLFAFLISGRASAAKNWTYPDSYGVYILDKGVFTRLTDLSPGPESEDIKHRTFSKDMSILIFEKWLTDPAENINLVAILDWRSIGEHPMLQVCAAAKPVENHQGMIMIVPDEPMKPGLYTFEIGSKSHDYQFGVETPDIADYWKTVEDERPKSWQAHNHLGAILYARGEVKEAYSHFLKAVEINPDNPEVHNNLGLALRSLGELNGAIEQFEAAVKISDDTAIHTNLADAYLQAKRYEDAVEAYRQAILLDFKNISARCNLGYALMERGKVDDAIAEFQKALEIDPNMPQAQSNLKEALKRKANGP